MSIEANGTTAADQLAACSTLVRVSLPEIFKPERTGRLVVIELLDEE